MDHLEMVYRREETPLLSADYERQKEEGLKYHKAARITLLQTSKEKHMADFEIKKRLRKILPDYRELRIIIEDKRRGEFENRRNKAKEQIALKEKRRQQILEQRKREREATEEAERLRLEEEEKLAEKQKIQQEEKAKMVAQKRAEIEERMGKLQMQSEIQEKWEEEVEARL
jgi:translation initiation factor 3 subunit A